MEAFINDRLEKQTMSIFDPIKKQKLHTFGNIAKSKSVKMKEKLVTIQNKKIYSPKSSSLLIWDNFYHSPSSSYHFQYPNRMVLWRKPPRLAFYTLLKNKQKFGVKYHFCDFGTL